jgi:indole-3-glycerol phosphate synthase
VKLFQKLLITPAVLGLLTPLASSANELNLTEVSSYSSSEEVQSINEFNAQELAVNNSLVDGLEAELNNFEASSFSETTTMSGSASFKVGAVDESAITEKTYS